MMVMKDKKPWHDEIPDIDEGWWAAVMADEHIFVPTESEEDEKSIESESQIKINWQYADQVQKNDEVVELKVQGYNRGGLLVQGEKLQGFVPLSHLVNLPPGISEEERHNILSGYVGATISLKIIECEPTAERIVFSERAAIAGKGRRKEIFDSLAPNRVVEGYITNVTAFGVFVDLGGVEGLIHVSELSWGRVNHPEDCVRIGDQVKVLVMSVDELNNRIALSLKRLAPNPWELLAERYQPGDVVTATVTSITKFGIFAKLPEGIEGLIHISSIKFPEDQILSDQFSDGQSIHVQILHLDVERRRLGLGLVQTE
jgi:small subunit ribosomal protein S1